MKGKRRPRVALSELMGNEVQDTEVMSFVKMYTKPKDFIVRYLAERGGDFALNAYPERNDSSSEWLEMTANTQLRLERAFKELRLARYKPQTCDAFSRAGTCPAGKSCDCVHDPTPWRRDALPDLAPNKRLKTVGLDGSYYGTPALPPKPRAERPHGFGPCGFGANGRCDWRGAHGGGRSYSDGGGGWRAGAPSAGFHASTEGAVDSSHGGYGGAAGDSAHVHGRGPLDAVHSGGSAVAAASAGADERSRGQRQQQQRGSRHGSRTHAPDRDYGHDSCVGGGREYNSNGSGHGWDKPGRGWDNPIRSKRIDESGRGGQNWRDGGRERRHSGAKDGHSSRDGR